MNTTPSHEIDSLDPDLLEQPLASGRTAEVFDSGGGWVVKLFAFGIGKEDAMAELDALKTAKLAGVNVPEPGDLVLMKMRWGYAMKRIDGPNGMTLIEQGLNPAEVGVRYADLHFGLAQHPGKFLPKLTDQMTAKIASSPRFDEAQKASLFALLAGMPVGTSMLHGDFHPGNVLWPSDGEPVFVDWINASQGNTAADVARSLVLFGFQTQAGSDSSRKDFTAAYLSRWEELSPGISEQAEKWLPLVRAVRLDEPAEAAVQELLDLTRSAIG